MRLDEPPRLDGLPPGARLALRRLDTEAGVRLLGWVIAVVMALALVVLVGRGGSTPKDPKLVGGLAPPARLVTDRPGTRAP